MLFVDGENLAIRGRKVAEAKKIALVEGPCYMKDVFLWFPNIRATQQISMGHLQLQPQAIRAFYYTSAIGDEPKLKDIRERLWNLGFSPEVSKKERGDEKAKGVDIALSKDLLTNAFRDNFDVAALMAGDGDYVPLVKEVKTLGKVVYVAFFEKEGLNSELRLAADAFTDLTPSFRNVWGSKGT
jgi:uncharacterized LabA/DUF88 family protein